jgi:hypothetical protein
MAVRESARCAATKTELDEDTTCTPWSVAGGLGSEFSSILYDMLDASAVTRLLDNEPMRTIGMLRNVLAKIV